MKNFIFKKTFYNIGFIFLSISTFGFIINIFENKTNIKKYDNLITNS